MNKKKFHLAGEIALLIVLLINSLGVDLMSKSGFGISTISSVPLVFNIAFPVFSFGTWNYIFQTLLVIALMILKRSFCPGYLFSFVVGIGFGKNDRRTQRMDPGSAELPASSHDLFPGRILTGVLRYLPCQQLYASNHPDRYLPSRSVRYCKKEL